MGKMKCLRYHGTLAAALAICLALGVCVTGVQDTMPSANCSAICLALGVCITSVQRQNDGDEAVDELNDAAWLLYRTQLDEDARTETLMVKTTTLMGRVLSILQDPGVSEETKLSMVFKFSSHSIIYSLLYVIEVFNQEGLERLQQLVRKGLSYQQGTRTPLEEDLRDNSLLILHVMDLYERDPSKADQLGALLRGMFSRAMLAGVVFNNPKYFRELLDYPALPGANTKLAMDMLDTIQVLLKSPKASEHTAKFTDDFFAQIDAIYRTGNDEVKAKAIRVFQKFLVTKADRPILFKYLSDLENLKVIVELLTTGPVEVQIEAFQMFKIFVINPFMPTDMRNYFRAHKAELVTFLQNFNPASMEGTKFVGHKHDTMLYLQMV